MSCPTIQKNGKICGKPSKHGIFCGIHKARQEDNETIPVTSASNDTMDVLREIKVRLDSMATGVSNTVLIKDILNLLLCKIQDEKCNTNVFNEMNDENIMASIGTLFDAIKDPTDTINIDVNCIKFIVGKLKNHKLYKNDCIGDAFQMFIHKNLRYESGQFFTPSKCCKNDGYDS